MQDRILNHKGELEFNFQAPKSYSDPSQTISRISALSNSRPTLYLRYHGNPPVMDVIVIRRDKVLANKESTPLVARFLIETIHWTRVLTETVRKPTFGFSNVQLVTALVSDDIHYAGHIEIVPSH